MSAALFTRRAKTGWLEELDGIRGDALAHPRGGVDEAMADADAEQATEPESSPLRSQEAPLPPASHPSRPEEIWHPGVDLGRAIAPPPPPQPVDDGPDAAAPESPTDSPAASSGRFSFARLRAVLPNPDQNEPALSDSPVGHGEARPSLLSELVAPYETQDADEPTGPPKELWIPEEERQAPVVPPNAAPAGQSLINGPVQRRGDGAEAPDHRRGLPPVVAVDHPVPMAEPFGSVRTPEPEPAPEPEPEPEPMRPTALDVEADGTVRLADGHLRFAQRTADVPTLGADGAEVVLADGWCWISAGPGEANRVSVQLPSLALRVEPSTVALVAVENDGALFVVIVAGEATLEHPATRLRLRRGAMALTVPGGEPQVDIATDEEIASDPLVAKNQHLDLAR